MTLAFDFKDPKEISAVSLTLDSPLEPIVGYAKGISGIVHFDPARPEATTGQVAVDVSSVQFANDGYTATARGYALEGTKYPQIIFALKKVVRVTRLAPNVYRGSVLADFICHGVTTPLTVPMEATYFPGRAEERTNGKFKGDILVLRTHFAVSRTRQGISAGIPASMVGDSVQVGVAVVGIHYAGNPPVSEAAPKKAAARHWDIEAENRDNPRLVSANIDLTPDAPSLSLHTEAGDIAAENVTLGGKTLSFRLPDSAPIGSGTGRIVFEGDTLRGTFQSGKDTLTLHGRLHRLSVSPAPAAAAVPSLGFRGLTIHAQGKEWTLAERMAFHHVPAVSLARIANFEVVETGAFGVTDVETRQPVTENTLFQAGGMGSPLVNLLALRLAAQGRLNLNLPVNACLKSAQILPSPFTASRPVTVLDLINGTSGLTQYKFAGYPPLVPRPTLAALLGGADTAEMEPLEAKAAPGTFTGGGIHGALLEQVIVDVLGQPLPELMQAELFSPLGMTHSFYAPLPPGSPALGHYGTGELTLDHYHIYPETGETGLWTTAGDFARMLCQLQCLLSGKPNSILGAGHEGLLKQVMAGEWVLGLIRSKSGDFLPPGFLYHGGASYGYYANHATHETRGYGVVVLENRNLGYALNNEIIQAVAQQNGWDSVPGGKA